MDPEDERRLRKNWSLLKQELRVDDLLHKLVDQAIFSASQAQDIFNVIPNTRSMRAEKFLQAIIQSGDRGYKALCNVLRENTDNRYSQVIDVLEITTIVINHDTMPDSRPSTGRPSTGLSSVSEGSVSTRSLPSRDGETGERNIRPARSARRAWRSDSSASESVPDANLRNNCPPDGAEGASSSGSSTMTRQSSTGEIIASAAHALQHHRQFSSMGATGGGEGINLNVDMKTLEKELVRIAPTIAELFQKISIQTTSNVPTTEEELQRVKDENERLSKTNKALIEKLNAFQKRIIQLQIENKKLKDDSDVGKAKGVILDDKADELDMIGKRLAEQKQALEAKERDLNLQLKKLKEIEDENEEQREKIGKLEELQEEGMIERNIQQEQISLLVEEKETQNEKIGHLEDKQRKDEHKLFMLEERLLLLEQTGNQQRRQRRSNGRRSPPRSQYWMNGVVERSHHANVKFQPEIRFQPERSGRAGTNTKKGWYN